MFNQAKVTNLALAVIALVFIVSCGVNKSTAVPIASRPLEQPVEVSQDNAWEDEVLPQPPLDLSSGAKPASEPAPGITLPEEIVSDAVTVPVVENKVVSKKPIELEANWESDITPVVENNVISSEQVPRHQPWKHNTIPTQQELETNRPMIDGSDPTTLTHWEQRWLAGE
ncbi:MAG: hypothetical protein KJ077_45470 [Anaerolineae bacterium]|nr:hypothetical protein [Anaerolineae bacterium]